MTAGTTQAWNTGPTQEALETAKRLARRKIQNSGTWFWWIGVLTVVNAVLGFMGVQLVFATGMSNMPAANQIMAGILAGTTAVTFVVLGMLAGRGHRWAFVAGALLYTADLLVAFAVLWMSSGGALSIGAWRALATGAVIHLYIVYRLFQGINACDEYKVIEDMERRAPKRDLNLSPPPDLNAPTYIVRY